MEYFASGAQADIYKDGSRAIKLFKYSIPKEDIEYEMKLQKTAFEYGLPVPKIFNFTEINGRFGFVMEYINGVPLGKLIFDDNSKLSEYMEKSIEIQRDLHKIETSKFPGMKNKLIRFIMRINKLNEVDKEKILLKLENMAFQSKLCHGDFHVQNLLQTSTEIVIIDWICSCAGTPEPDIYRTYLLYKLFNPEIAELYLDIYCKTVKIDKAKILEWALVVTAARLGEYTKDENEEKMLIGIIRNNMY